MKGIYNILIILLLTGISFTGFGQVQFASNDPVKSSIYPNPVSDFAEITFPSAQSKRNTEIVVYSLLGNKVAAVKPSFGSNSIRVDLSNETPGVYFYTILEDNRSILTKKFILK